MKTFFRATFTALALFLVAGVMPTALHAQNLNEIRSNMAKRLPQIDKLKASGALGENNLGYLTVRENKDNAGSVASAENADRKTVYASIAARQKVSAEEVGKARARQIAQQSKPGVWVQDAQGNWKKK